MKRKTIRIRDDQGKTWVFRQRDIVDFYFNNDCPNDYVVVNLPGASVRFTKQQLAEAMPHLFAEMDIKI